MANEATVFYKRLVSYLYSDGMGSIIIAPCPGYAAAGLLTPPLGYPMHMWCKIEPWPCLNQPPIIMSMSHQALASCQKQKSSDARKLNIFTVALVCSLIYIVSVLYNYYSLHELHYST